jgi:hypothetical protein
MSYDTDHQLSVIATPKITKQVTNTRSSEITPPTVSEIVMEICEDTICKVGGL